MFDKHFKFDNKLGSIIFTGKTMKIRIPERYSSYKGCLVIENTVTSLAIFPMTINGVEKLFFLPAIIEIEFSEMQTVIIDDTPYLELTLFKGDRFMVASDLVANKSLGYILFYEFVQLGNYPVGVTYGNIPRLFDSLKKFSGIDFGVDPSVVEIMFSQLHRDNKDMSKLYRLTDMSKQPHRIPMRDITHAARSTTGRLVGNYLSGAIDSVIVNKSDSSSEIEDILRK